MNLWVKSVRQLTVLAVALFFFSCEDEASLIGFKDPKPKFNVRYIDIPLASSVVLMDSFATDHKPNLNKYLSARGSYLSTVYDTLNNSVLVGEYIDPVLGNTRTEAFLQLTPLNIERLDPTATLDSITMDVRFNYYTYGFASDQQMTFNVHEVTEAMDGDLYTRYFSSTPPRQIDPTPIGQLKVFVKNSNVVKYAGLSESRQDTLQATARLDNEYGAKLFNLAYHYTDSIFAKTEKFIEAVKGLSIQPTQTNGIMGIYTFSSLTRVQLHYHFMKDGTSTKAIRSFSFISPQTDKLYEPHYTSISVNRGGSELGGAVPYQSIEPPSGLRVVQSGAPVVTRLDLSNFYAFADTVENVVINTAELVISDVESPAGFAAPSRLLMKPMKGNQFTNHALDADSLGMVAYVRTGTVFPDTKHYYLSREDTGGGYPSALSYNSGQKKYSVFLTFFTQTLFQKKDVNGAANPDRIHALGLQSAPSAMFKTVNRALFNSNNVKLRIFYTKPNQVQ